MRWRRVGIAAAVLVVIGMLGGVGWIAWWVNDNIGAPGPPPTGSGPCGRADSVNLELVFANGRTVQACTHDRPACPNQTVSGSGNGQTFSESRFGLGIQLRSTSRRYIFSMSFNASLPLESAEQTLQIEPGAFLSGPPGSGSTDNRALTSAVVQVTPRDPYEDAYTPVSGSVSVASTRGVARGSIDGTFSTGPTRTDRPAPTATAATPIRVTGTFACDR